MPLAVFLLAQTQGGASCNGNKTFALADRRRAECKRKVTRRKAVGICEQVRSGRESAGLFRLFNIAPDLGWADVEVNAEAGGCQTRHHACGGLRLADPGDVQGQHAVHHGQHGHGHIKPFQRQRGVAHEQHRPPALLWPLLRHPHKRASVRIPNAWPIDPACSTLDTSVQKWMECGWSAPHMRLSSCKDTSQPHRLRLGLTPNRMAGLLVL